LIIITLYIFDYKYIVKSKSLYIVGKMKWDLITWEGPTPKPPKGGFNSQSSIVFKPPLGGLGVEFLPAYV